MRTLLIGMIVSLFLVFVGSSLATDISKGKECLLKKGHTCATQLTFINQVKKCVGTPTKNNPSGLDVPKLMELMERTDINDNPVVFSSEKEMKVIVKGMVYGYVQIEVVKTGRILWVFPTSLICR